MPRKIRQPHEIVTFPVRVPGELWNRITEQAHRDDRSVHAVVVELLTQYADKKPTRTPHRKGKAEK